MVITFDMFTDAFLNKVTEYNIMRLDKYDRQEIVDGYMRRAIAEFNKICVYDLVGTRDEDVRRFFVDIPDEDIDEIVDIVSEGMCVQWLKPYFYKTENLEIALNTPDFYAYSPAELLYRITNAYKESKADYMNMMREYSYNHGNLVELHM